MSTKKKARPSSARSPKSKGDNNLGAEGIYSNPYFMNSVVALVGSTVRVHTASGTVYEGILKTFSPQFDVVVELAHKVDTSNSMHSLESVVGKMVFKQQGIVKIDVIDQDLDYATRDAFLTDAAISSKYNGGVEVKDLEPWDGTMGGDDFELETSSAMNGWDVNDMFRQNEEVFGVTSNFDHGLAGYTTPLQKESKDYKEAEAKASKIASEIEKTAYYKNRIELENGDEEETFAAVVRPADGETSNKYVPPQRRKPSQAKPTRTSSSSPPSAQPPVAKASSPVVSPPPQPPPPAPVQQPPQPPQPQPSPAPSNGPVREQRPPERVERVERVNGNPTYESPKPQRINSTVRHGRNFSADTSRSASNGSMSSPTSTISSASSTTNHEPHHRNPPPPSYPHAAPVVINPPHEHKVQHNHNQQYVQPVPSPAPQEHHRYGHPGPNPNTDYRGAQVHQYVHSHQNNAISPSNMPEYIPQRGHYGGHPVVSTLPNDHRHYGHIAYSVPMMSQAATVVEMRGQPPQEGEMMQPQPPIVQSQMHYRKPPIVTPHSVVDHPMSQMPHKTTRRRKEIGEMKTFSQDFKLAEPEEVMAKRSPHGEEDQQPPQMSGRIHDNPSEIHTQQMQRPAPAAKPEPPVIKSKLNPNAKEFVYNPTKPAQFTPAMSTPSQSRPHTPQTPAGYAPLPPQQMGPPSMMMMPAYVVTTTQPPYAQPPAQQRYPKVHMGVPSQPSQMQVAAATGQPLLAPAPLPQFTVPYPPQGYLPQPYQQMVRMVQHGDGMPPVIATINFPGPEGGPQAAPMPFMAAPPPPPPQQHPQHPSMLHHPPQNNGSSPQSNGNNQMAYHRVTPRGW